MTEDDYRVRLEQAWQAPSPRPQQHAPMGAFAVWGSPYAAATPPVPGPERFAPPVPIGPAILIGVFGLGAVAAIGIATANHLGDSRESAIRAMKTQVTQLTQERDAARAQIEQAKAAIAKHGDALGKACAAQQDAIAQIGQELGK